LVKNCSKLNFNKKTERKLFNLGKFLAAFHNKYFLYYSPQKEPVAINLGDLNNRNIMFLRNGNVFIFDQAAKKDVIYHDMVRLMLNLRLKNYLLNLLLSEKGLRKLEKRFLQGYKSQTNFRISGKKIKESLLKHLRFEENLKMSTSLVYRIKKSLMLIPIKRQIKKIQNEKIQI
jgi:hypothetical protein